MAKVSVIIAAYNVEEYIDKCLKSMVNQTYKDIEIVVCDDRSTDNTLIKLKEWEKVDSRIIVLNNIENLGAAETRNKCIMNSTGQYIAVMDADDISLPLRIETQVEFLDGNPDYSIVGTLYEVFNKNGVVKKNSKKPEFPTKRDFLWTIAFAHPTVMMRKVDLLKVNCYRVSEETRRGQDYDLFARMYIHGMKGYNIQEVLFRYRVNVEDMAKRKYKNRIDEAKIKYRTFKTMGLLPIGYIYVAKPLIVGLIPQKLLFRIKKE